MKGPSMSMRVDVVSAMYNEELLLPFFLKHYEWACIHVLLDTDSDDRSVGMLSKCGNVKVYPITYPDGIDWEMKSDAVCDIAGKVDADWVIAVDADEFVWTPSGESVIDFLSRQKCDVVWAAMWSVVSIS